jgi:hypothetical protein
LGEPILPVLHAVDPAHRAGRFDERGHGPPPALRLEADQCVEAAGGQAGKRHGQGLYIDPGVWHEAVVPLAGRAAFDDRQGRVHARVSCTFVEEFGAYLSVPLRKP